MRPYFGARNSDRGLAFYTTMMGMDIADLQNASYVTISAEEALNAERVLTAGAGLTGTDGGANSTYTLAAGEGPGIDVTADAVGLGGDTILLFDNGGNPVAEHAATNTGFAAAIAAAASGDLIQLPLAITLSAGHTIPAGVTLRGPCVITANGAYTALLTVNSTSVLEELEINYTTTSTSGNIAAIYGAEIGTLRHIKATVTNSTHAAGTYGLKADNVADGTCIHNCYFNAVGNVANGTRIGIYIITPAGSDGRNITLTNVIGRGHCNSSGSTCYGIHLEGTQRRTILDGCVGFGHAQWSDGASYGIYTQNATLTGCVGETGDTGTGYGIYCDSGRLFGCHGYGTTTGVGTAAGIYLADEGYAYNCRAEVVTTGGTEYGFYCNGANTYIYGGQCEGHETDLYINSGTCNTSGLQYDTVAGAGTHNNELMTGLLPGTSVELEEVGTATYDDVQDWVNNTQSAGVISGGGFTDNGDGTLTVAAGTGFVKTTDSVIGVTAFLDWSENSTLTMTDEQVNYVYVDYNAASPIVASTITSADIDDHTQFRLGIVYQSGTTAHDVENCYCVHDIAYQVQHYIRDVHGPGRTSGIVTSGVGTSMIDVTAGAYHDGLEHLTTPAVNTQTGGDTFSTWYNDGSWVETKGETEIDNTYYNDYGTGLAELIANRYGVHWVYMHEDGDVHVVYGIGNYTLAQAEVATLPSNLPTKVVAIGIFVAKIIIQKSATSFTSVLYPWTTVIAGSAASDHGALAGLAGDDHPQYLLADGTRDLTGNMGVDAAVTIDGVDISAHTHSAAAGHGVKIPPTSLTSYARGSIIRGGAANWEAYSVNTNGAALVGDGTDIVCDLTPTWQSTHTFQAGITFGGAAGANAITVLDNSQDAFHVTDVGGIEYIKYRTVDSQPVVAYNDDGADVDFIVEASGVADAFQVQGSDGEITLGALGAGHLSADASGVIASSANIVLADAASIGITGNELLTVNAAGNFTFSGVASVVVPDGCWVGADAACSWVFNSTSGYVTTLDWVGVGTATPGQNIAGGTSDLSGQVMHIKSAASFGQFITEGALGSSWGLVDLGGGADDKWFNVFLDDGKARFRQVDDDQGGVLDLVTMDLGGNVGIATTAPGQIFDVNSGSGNMIADGYDNHPSFFEFKENVGLMDTAQAIERLRAIKPYQYTRAPFVSTDELVTAAVKHFKLSPPSDTRAFYENLKDTKILNWIAAKREELKGERRQWKRYQREHYSPILDAVGAAEALGDIIGRDENDNITGYSLNNYVGLLHACITELIGRVEQLEAK